MSTLIRHLPYFVVAAEEQHFQRAAERLKIAPSALSRRIRMLEEELGGITLFERLPRGVRLTESGNAFLQDVRYLLDQIDEAGKRAALTARGEQGRLRVSFVDAAARFPGIVNGLQAFRSAYPGLVLSLIPAPSQVQMDQLVAGEVDAGIMWYGPEDDAEFDSRLILMDDHILALPAGHPLAARDEIRVGDLHNEEFIWASRTQTRTMYDKLILAFHRHGVTPRILMEVYSVETTFNFIAMGIGMGIVPACLGGREPDGVVMRRIVDLNSDLPLKLVWPRHRLSAGLERFIEAIMASARAGPRPVRTGL